MKSDSNEMILVPGYRGPERRSTERRAAMPVDERGWRLQNLALSSADQRSSFGRRSTDLAFMQAA